MVNFKPTWLKVILSIIVAIIIYFFAVQIISSLNTRCLALLECTGEQVNIKVGSNHPGALCGQICGTPEEKIYWEEYYEKRNNLIRFSLKASPFIAFLLIYIVFSLVQKPKKK